MSRVSLTPTQLLVIAGTLVLGACGSNPAAPDGAGGNNTPGAGGNNNSAGDGGNNTPGAGGSDNSAGAGGGDSPGTGGDRGGPLRTCRTAAPPSPWRTRPALRRPMARPSAIRRHTAGGIRRTPPTAVAVCPRPSRPSIRCGPAGNGARPIPASTTPPGTSGSERRRRFNRT